MCCVAAEAAKVTAERAVHELQLDLRSQVEKYSQLQESRRYVSPGLTEITIFIMHAFCQVYLHVLLLQQHLGKQ